MRQQKMCLESFDGESFGALVSGLENEGYVIDGREVRGITFSSTQIEHINQDIFNQLCARFQVNAEVEVGVAGKFFSSQGAFYILYDTSIHDHAGAQKVLEKYVDTLAEF
ncbi:hypothetical protein [Thioalkalivibrio sp. ALJT]|uniref:hypothetical protein n=1 Tax=Thioalkalivibrio sp. ALJT TaxID=1158146 RepID=UPI0012DCE0BA|nr:hypothetical protein [Thioalkalivibrio sp. ALJT]